MLNAHDYNVPQDRKRVFFIGIRKDLNFKFEFPKPYPYKKTLKDAIGDLADNVVPSIGNNKANPDCKVTNHEYMTGGFSQYSCLGIGCENGMNNHLQFRLGAGKLLYIRKHL